LNTYIVFSIKIEEEKISNYFSLDWYKTRWDFPTATSDGAGPNYHPDGKTFLHLYQKFSSMKLNFSDGLSFFRRFIGFFRHVPTIFYIFIKTFHPWNRIFPTVLNFSNNFVEFFRQFIKFFRHFPTIYWFYFDIFDVVYIIIILYHVSGIKIH